MYRFFQICMLMMLSSTLIAQGIKFDNLVHDYGDIVEDGGKVECRFEFTNISTYSITVINVRPSCGCTASDWSKEAIMPGGRGYVTAIYDPLNRPGYFNKSITVVTNEPSSNAVTIYIKGNVTPKKKTKSASYPFAYGALKFKTNHLAFGEIKTNQIKTDSFAVYNDGASPVSIGFPELPAFLSAKAKPEVLNPGNEGFIIVRFDGSKRGDWGGLFDKLTLVTNDEQQPQKVLNISSNIIQDYSHLSAKELAKAPKFQFKSTTYDFGTIKQGSIIEFDFEFVNIGKSPLQIHRVRASCGCTASSPEKMLVKKNQKSKIHTSFNSAGRNGRQHLTINFISNDASQPDLVLTITGNVE